MHQSYLCRVAFVILTLLFLIAPTIPSHATEMSVVATSTDPADWGSWTMTYAGGGPSGEDLSSASQIQTFSGFTGWGTFEGAVYAVPYAEEGYLDEWFLKGMMYGSPVGSWTFYPSWTPSGGFTGGAAAFPPDSWTYATSAVPVPPTALLLGSGLIPLVWWRRKKPFGR